MLNIYLGRESLNKEKFMYESIKENGGVTYVIVPNQYTLESERQALRYMKTDALLDTEIVSFSRMGMNLISKYGRKDITRLDEYGKHMLLTKIFIENDDALKLFSISELSNSNTLSELLNDFITDAKLANIKPHDFDELLEDESLPEVLREKLCDLKLIFEKYEEEIDGKFIDAEDYIDIYTGLISESERIKKSEIWIYGFDSFTPKNTDIIAALCQNAVNVNVILTDSRSCRDDSLFTISRMVTKSLCSAASEAGIDHKINWIGDEYLTADRPEGIRTLERELFAESKSEALNSAGITLVKCSNIYSEIESAASKVIDLLCNEKLRYRDIVIISNGQPERMSVIKRTFEEHGIGIFDDSKRSIINSPVAVYLIGLLNAIENNYRTEDVITVAKTGLTALADDEVEDIELYANKYRIRNKAWKKTFKYGVMEYGEDGIAVLDEIRQKLISSFLPIEELSKESETMRDFVVGCYNILAASDFIKSIENVVLAQRMEGLGDVAEETEQIWSKIVSAFEQIVELMGEQKFDLKMLVDILIAGLSKMEVGVIPPTVDEVILGTMQRTRFSDVKAVIVMGANEGILPLIQSEDFLFSPEEASLLQEKLSFGDKAQIMSMEEKLAIYRNLSKPLETLWISYSASKEDGSEMIPSEIVFSIKKVFPELKEDVDVLSAGNVEKIVGGKVNTVRHMTKALNLAKAGAELEPGWCAVREWLEEKAPESVQKIVDGLYFDYKEKPIPTELAKSLYQRGSLVGTNNLSLSPSRLEKYSRCPFSHFLSYGLRPKEERIYEAGRREIGDLHHEVLALFARYLEQNELWNTITIDEAREKIKELVYEQADAYREAVFKYTSVEEYKLRRAVRIAQDSGWALVLHYRAGNLKESFFEIGFGRNREIKPIEIKTSAGTVYIEGKIDRVDVLPNESIKIIDYKSGSTAFNQMEVTTGYSLQLMLYLKAACEEEKRPAGVFYFHIQDPLKSAEMNFSKKSRAAISKDFSKELRKIFNLDGIIVDDAEIIRSIAGEFADKSEVLPLSRKKDGTLSKGRTKVLISAEELSEIQKAFDETIGDLCSSLVSGDISISPKRVNSKDPCQYCDYKAICRYDLHKLQRSEE